MTKWHICLTLGLLGCPRPSPTDAAADPAEVAPDTALIPGERAGPITATTTLADLEARFGAAALSPVEVDLGEGFTAAGVRVRDGEDDAISVLWEDPSRVRVTQLRDLGPAWRTPEGVGLGTTLAELEAAAGPFELLGFGWDYSGTVLLTGTALAAWDGLLVLRMRPTAPDASVDRVLGDNPYASSNPDVVALAPVVREVIVNLE